jgi:hypothetical protein
VFELSKPFSERRSDGTMTVGLCPGRCLPPALSFRETQVGRNRKDLKGLKCHYTFGIRTVFRVSLYRRK